eukprot:9468251-Pyramimonas_sp.AAC.1
MDGRICQSCSTIGQLKDMSIIITSTWGLRQKVKNQQLGMPGFSCAGPDWHGRPHWNAEK